MCKCCCCQNRNRRLENFSWAHKKNIDALQEENRQLRERVDRLENWFDAIGGRYLPHRLDNAEEALDETASHAALALISIRKHEKYLRYLAARVRDLKNSIGGAK